MTAAELLERLRSEYPPGVLAALSKGLRPAGQPLSFLGLALLHASDGGGSLPELQLRFAVRELREFGGEELLGRLAAAEEPPWCWVAEAVLAVEREPAAS